MRDDQFRRRHFFNLITATGVPTVARAGAGENGYPAAVQVQTGRSSQEMVLSITKYCHHGRFNGFVGMGCVGEALCGSPGLVIDPELIFGFRQASLPV